ncbi:Short-chain dehydrogenase TIC 32 [Colletotrichum tropicale]|nr:Short-chain dehydrogenase TIC 32 [Colletotrichum tropicale]
MKIDAHGTRNLARSNAMANPKAGGVSWLFLGRLPRELIKIPFLEVLDCISGVYESNREGAMVSLEDNHVRDGEKARAHGNAGGSRNISVQKIRSAISRRNVPASARSLRYYWASVKGQALADLPGDSNKYTNTNTDKRTAGELATLYAAQIKGKIILTTGVSPGGVGAAFVKALATVEPALLVLAGRNPGKVQQTAEAISEQSPSVKVRTLDLDLASLEGVRKAAATGNAWDDVPRIDVLVNNAAVMAVNWATSPEGLDSQFVTNYLGPFLFTNLLIDKLLKSPAPRIINVTSDGHRLGPVRFR